MNEYPTQGSTALSNVRTARKKADETVNDSATLQNDDALKLAVLTNQVWLLDLVLFITTGATPDFKFQFTVPTGATIRGTVWSNASITAGAVNVASFTDAAAVLINGAMTARPVHLQAVVVVGATAGTVQLQWAQNTQDASDTTVLANSVLVGVLMQ